MRRIIGVYFLVAAIGLTAAGCGSYSRIMGSTIHQKCGWKAEEYFADPQVIALCRAIEADDLAEIDRLVAAGADVNAVGKGKMTPLLWAYPDNKLKRFTRLLEHGANPNVIIESDFNTRGYVGPGDSVTHLACDTSFSGYFEAVFAHGGDPNLLRQSNLVSSDTPLFTVITGSGRDKTDRVQLLIGKGADLNHVSGSGATATMVAAGRGHYNIALVLLDAGADYKIYQQNQMMRLIHVVNRGETRLVHSTPQQKADYKRLVEWLEERGETIDEAKADEERWASWGGLGLERKSQLMNAERDARLAREAAKKGP